MQKVEHDKMVEIVYSKEVKKIIEDDLKYFDENAFTDSGAIKSYKIDATTIEHNPMGGIMFDVYVNNDHKLQIGFILEKNNGVIQSSSLDYSEELSNYVKEHKNK